MFAQLQEELSEVTELDNFVEYKDDQALALNHVYYFIPSQNKHF